MAKKRKAPQDLKALQLSFTENEVHYELLRYHPDRMEVHCKRIDKGESLLIDLPFAHLPKALKKILKPL